MDVFNDIKLRTCKYKPLIGLHRARLFEIPINYSNIRISTMELVAAEIYEKKIDGSVAELGVFQGNFAQFINQAFPDRKFFLFDTFSGFNDKDLDVEKKIYNLNCMDDFSQTSINLVMKKMKYPKNIVIKKGCFPETAIGLDEKFAFVSIDADLYQPTIAGLRFFYPHLNKGGYIFVHDYNNDGYPGIRQAVNEFQKENSIPIVPMTDSWGSIIIAK